MLTNKLLNRVARNEGFRAKPYKDSVGKWTVGHGWCLEDRPITHAESLWFLNGRLKKLEATLAARYTFWAKLSNVRRGVLIEMSYQLGVTGLSKFKKMLSAIRSQKYSLASQEGLTSKWAIQTPLRAKRLMQILALGKDDV